MMAETDPMDPKGLIADAYRIEGIGPGECRTIFLDWALSLPEDVDQIMALRSLIERHAGQQDRHPMTTVMRDGLIQFGTPRRRGGWKARPRD